MRRATGSTRSRPRPVPAGNPISFALQDETGKWTKPNKMIEVGEAQRRGAAGMGGRTMETTNCYDPAEALRAADARVEVRRRLPFWRKPPEHLSYRNKVERQQIHRYVYFGSPWVDLNDIEGEAAEIMQTDPAQAERFFGNRIVAGSGAWLTAAEVKKRVVVRDRPKGEPICLGFDGSDVDDWTALRAETFGSTSSRRSTNGRPTIWNPAEFDGRVPRLDVLAAIDFVFAHFDVVRAYIDPPGWESQVSYLQGKYGEKRVVEWPTYRITDARRARAVQDRPRPRPRPR
jgi:hypothetical protein